MAGTTAPTTGNSAKSSKPKPSGARRPAGSGCPAATPWSVSRQAFPDLASVTRERVQPYVIRTEKRRAIDAEGQPLFKPRRTQLGPVSWAERHRQQQLLYEAVTEYVREGYKPGPAGEAEPHRLPDDSDAAPGGLQHPRHPHHP